MKFATVFSTLSFLAGYAAAQGASSFTQPVETTSDGPSVSPTLPGPIDTSVTVDPTIIPSSVVTVVPDPSSIVTIQTSIPESLSTDLTSVTSSPTDSSTFVTITTPVSSPTISLPSSSSTPLPTTTNGSGNQNNAAVADLLQGNGVIVGAVGVVLGMML
ncbi:hypothetical protein ONZ45_g6410 [Pleurotus djamor]|nr:hypothetical protein ONZ45_g6410 [Pleurotus djamor]